MSEETDQARQAGLRAAAVRITEAMRLLSPSEYIAASWRLSNREFVSVIKNSAVSAIMTNVNSFHPSWGRPPNHYTNDRNPARTHWADRAIVAAVEEAEQEFLDAYLHSIAIDSNYLEVD